MTSNHHAAIAPPNIKALTLRRHAYCGCGARLQKGTVVGWDRAALVVRCPECVAQAHLAARELLFGDEADPQLLEHHEREHEVRFRASLAPHRDDLQLLHDRRILRSRSRIDHLIVAPTGVYIITVRSYADRRIAVTWAGGLFTPSRAHLRVDGRDKSHLVTALNRQTRAVTTALALDPSYETVPVTALICATDAHFPRWESLDVEGVLIRNLQATERILSSSGELDALERAAIARHLARHLPPAYRH